MPDVLVAGGGPTGLLAAFELERAGLDVLVLERDARPTTQSKALGLQPRSVEVLADRGLLTAVEPHAEARLPAGHFSGIPIDYADLPTRFPGDRGGRGALGLAVRRRGTARHGTARQLERYRHSRVLFAGDAAHIHLPVGGQGLNLGLQDAVNLGWKLGAQVRGHASDGLLDSYHDERHPVAARVLVSTRAQAVIGVPDPDASAVREIVAWLIAVPEARRAIALELSGIGITYSDTTGRTTDIPVAPDGRGVLVGASLPVGWADRVETRDGPGRQLVRPDGYVAWAGGPGLDAALSRWFGLGRN